MANTNGGTDLRIYWGNARVILRADDPRTPKILALLAKDELRVPAGEDCVQIPGDDAAMMDLLGRFFAARKGARR